LASPLAVGVLACAAVGTWAIFSPGVVLQSWLIGFATIAGAPLGAFALLCVARLTGGRWAQAASPALHRMALATPLLIAFVLPVIFGAQRTFPWAADPNSAGKEVARFYLNVGFLSVRNVVALGALAIFAIALATQRVGRVCAALGLVLYAIAIDFMSVDWLLSLSPRFSSSAFGAEMAVQNIACALALILAASPAVMPEGAPADLAGLTLAAALGVLYMEAMALIVNWYGDQPDRAAWYLAHGGGVWLWVAIVAAIVGFLAPICALMLGKVRRSPAMLRAVGAALLFGIAARDFWLAGPSVQRMAPLAAILAMVGMAGLALALSSWLGDRLLTGETEP
jgi:hypothetical protein